LTKLNRERTDKTNEKEIAQKREWWTTIEGLIEWWKWWVVSVTTWLYIRRVSTFVVSSILVIIQTQLYNWKTLLIQILLTRCEFASKWYFTSFVWFLQTRTADGAESGTWFFFSF
jgi:hypothetical protein